MPHVDDGTLHALLDGALRADDPASAAEVERHLAGCPDCRARLEAADSLRGRASGVLAAAAPAEPVAAPDFDEVRARASRSGGRRHAPAALRRQVRWTRNVAWAASLVIALGTGYLLRDLADPPDAASRDGEVQSEVRSPEPDPTRGSQAAAPAAESPELAESPVAQEPEASEELVREQAPSPEPPQSAVADAEEDADLEAETLALPPVESAARLRQSGAETAAAAAADVSRSMDAGRAGAISSLPGPAEVEEQWSVATLAEAREAMEGPVYRLPRAEILEVYVGSAATRPAVMTRQRLESGIPVQVVQRWGESAAPPAAEKAEADGAGLPRPERAITTRGDYVLEVTGSLPAALLEILAESATPAP